MKIATAQLKTTKSIKDNFNSIIILIEKAKDENVELILFPECCLTGYPPIEIQNINDINYDEVDIYIKRLDKIASDYNMVVLIGSVICKDNKKYNNVEILGNSYHGSKSYSKRALWGWDQQNFIPGVDLGIFTFKGFNFGIRICYEIRFPEYFRELFKNNIDVALVSFCDVSENENINRYNLIMGHIRTRAVENAFTVMTSNSISNYKTAPTCIIDQDGNIIMENKDHSEELLIYNLEKNVSNFGRDGRIIESKKLTTAST